MPPSLPCPCPFLFLVFQVGGMAGVGVMTGVALWQAAAAALDPRLAIHVGQPPPPPLLLSSDKGPMAELD